MSIAYCAGRKGGRRYDAIAVSRGSVRIFWVFAVDFFSGIPNNVFDGAGAKCDTFVAN